MVTQSLVVTRESCFWANNETLSECETKDVVHDIIETEMGFLIVMFGGLSLCFALILMSSRCIDRMVCVCSQVIFSSN